jgi:hypothetical protein
MRVHPDRRREPHVAEQRVRELADVHLMNQTSTVLRSRYVGSPAA